MKKGRILFYLVLFSFSFFLLGYFRNFIFLNINERSSLLYYKSAYSPLPTLLSMFESYDYNRLVAVKWMFTLSFTITYAILSAVTLYTIFKERDASFIALGLYAFVFTISLLFMIIGRLFLSFYLHGFNISRNLIHFEQSPVITLVLLLGIYYYKKNK